MMNLTMNCLFSGDNTTPCSPPFHGPHNATNENGQSAASVSITAVSFLLNFAALVDLTIQRRLKSPFDVYIIVLLSSNIIYLTTHGTLTFLTNSFHIWWIGNQGCTLHIYNRYFTNPFILHIHLVIGLNRGWAMTFPVSYRNHHTYKFAWLVCLGMVLYIHACQLPGFILDAVYYRLPLEKGCWVNTRQLFAWEMFSTFWMYAPKLLIPLAYPFLVWKWLRTRFRRAGRRVSVVPFEIAVGGSVPSDSRLRDDAVPTSAAVKDSRRSRPFILLTSMTITALVCWMPSFMYYCLIAFNYPANRMETLGKVAGAVSPFQALVDPIIFCFGTSTLYTYFSQIYK